MWIRLDLEGLKFELKIEDYLPNQTLDGKWSNVSFNFEFQNIIKYSQNRSENMLCYEIDELILNMEDLLNDRLIERKVVEEIEPDFTFIFNPKDEQKKGIDMEMKVRLWDGGLTCNYFATTFGREEIEQLLLYLSLITGKIESEDLRIKKLIENGIIYGELK